MSEAAAAARDQSRMPKILEQGYSHLNPGMQCHLGKSMSVLFSISVQRSIKLIDP